MFWLTRTPPTLLRMDPSELFHACFHSQLAGITKVRSSISFPHESSTVSWKASSWLSRELFSFKESRLFRYWTVLDYEGNIRLADRCTGLLEKPKITTGCVAEVTEIYFLTALEARSPRWRCGQIWFILRLLSLACRRQSSRCVLIWSFLCVCSFLVSLHVSTVRLN